jgi:hypothetical protein
MNGALFRRVDSQRMQLMGLKRIADSRPGAHLERPAFLIHFPQLHHIHGNLILTKKAVMADKTRASRPQDEQSFVT